MAKSFVKTFIPFIEVSHAALLINKIIPPSCICFIALIIASCQKNPVLPADYYRCNTDFSDSSAAHPKAAAYQKILDDTRKTGIVGMVLLVKDRHGLWMGASGKADLASNVNVSPCNTFLIVEYGDGVKYYIIKRLISLRSTPH
jgi:hypothetical protein